MKNKYEESLSRIAFNFGLDCIEGKADNSLIEDIKNIDELINKFERVESALDKACNILGSFGFFIKPSDRSSSSNEWKEYLLNDKENY